jgi:hypothetical protein
VTDYRNTRFFGGSNQIRNAGSCSFVRRVLNHFRPISGVAGSRLGLPKRGEVALSLISPAEYLNACGQLPPEERNGADVTTNEGKNG